MKSVLFTVFIVVVLTVVMPFGGRAQDGTSREAPIPVGQEVAVNNYSLRVVGANFDATDLVHPENMFNQPPVPGNVFVLVRLEATYSGTGIGSLASDLQFQVVGNANRGYSRTGENDCGVVPEDAYLVGDVFPGAELEFNVCWQVSAEEAPTLEMYVEAGFSGGAPVFFALPDPTQGSPIAPVASPGASPPASPMATPVPGE